MLLECFNPINIRNVKKSIYLFVSPSQVGVEGPSGEIKGLRGISEGGDQGVRREGLRGKLGSFGAKDLWEEIKGLEGGNLGVGGVIGRGMVYHIFTIKTLRGRCCG